METFRNSFERFASTIPHDSKIPQIIENIQYYHDCSDAALARPKEDNDSQFLGIDAEEIRAELLHVDADTNDFETSIYSENYTEEDIEAVRKAREADRERIYGERAISLAKEAGIFEQETDELNNRMANMIQPVARKANSVTLDSLRLWDNHLTTATRLQIKESGMVDLATIQSAEVTQGEVDEVHLRKRTIKPGVSVNLDIEKDKRRPLVAMLNAEQQRAHDIIEETLQKELSGENESMPLSFPKKCIERVRLSNV